nr:hypothetical protein [Planctomycetales bacterium]NIP70503.1 hypothetical protein [Planctomycetales bacterium]
DVAANLAGVEMAEALRKNKLRLAQLEKNFQVSRYVPEVANLEEGLSMEQLTSRYGPINSPQFGAYLESLRRQIRQLPGFQTTGNQNRPAPARSGNAR